MRHRVTQIFSGVIPGTSKKETILAWKQRNVHGDLPSPWFPNRTDQKLTNEPTVLYHRLSYPNLLWVISLSNVSNSCHLKHLNLWVHTSDKWLLQHCTCEINWPAGSSELSLSLSPSIHHCGSESSHSSTTKLRKLSGLGTQLSRSPLEEISILHLDSQCRRAEEPCQSSWSHRNLEGKESSGQIGTMWHFLEIGDSFLEHRRLGWTDTSYAQVPDRRWVCRRATCDIHMQKMHSRAKGITIIIWKGHLVHEKINCYNLHSLK